MDRPIEGVAKLNPDTGDGEFISVSNELNFTYTPPPLECRVEGLLSKRRGTDGLNCPNNGGVEYLDGIATKDQVPPAAANLVQTCATASSECTTACVPSIPCSTNPERSPNCIGYAQCGILVSLPVATGLAKTCANPLSGECQTICSQAKAHCPIPAASAAIALAGGATAEAAAGSWAVAAAAAKENFPNCGGYGACAIAHAAYAAGMAAMAAAAGATATSECNRWICCTRLRHFVKLDLEAPVERYASASFIPGRACWSSTACSALMVPASMRLAPRAIPSVRTVRCTSAWVCATRMLRRASSRACSGVGFVTPLEVTRVT